MAKLGRNDPCPCGSGKKLKACCESCKLDPVAAAGPERGAGLQSIGELQLRKGLAWLQAGKPAQARAELEMARALLPRHAEAWHLSGLASYQLHQHEEAVAQLRRALSLNDSSAAIWSNLGNIEEERGDLQAALRTYEAALQRFPEDLAWRFRRLRALLPSILGSAAEIDTIREQLERALDEIANAPGQLAQADHAALVLFNLAYHGRDDRRLMERLAALLPAPAVVLPAAPAADGRLRIGICSDFLHQHTIGKLNQGYITRLDRSRFRLCLIHPAHAKRDALHDAMNAAADQVLYLPDQIDAAERSIAALGLDLLHFPDIGMSPFGYLLASRRMAAVQTTSWGHPVSSGLPSIDYFLSFGAAEPEGAEQHYSERLVRLVHPPVYYEAPEPVPATPSELTALPEGRRLYACLQSLFKFHPDFDAVLLEILRRDPEALIVAIAGEQPRWTAALQARLAARDEVLSRRIVFLPRVAPAAFRALIARMDLLLDTPHFGSGNTIYESLDLGVPTVTWPGAFMRGRLVAAVYDYLGIDDAPVATRLEDYALLAVAIASDGARRARLSAQLKAQAPRLYRNDAAVREFEAFCASAISAARGTQAPEGNP